MLSEINFTGCSFSVLLGDASFRNVTENGVSNSLVAASGKRAEAVKTVSFSVGIRSAVNMRPNLRHREQLRFGSLTIERSPMKLLPYTPKKVCIGCKRVCWRKRVKSYISSVEVRKSAW